MIRNGGEDEEEEESISCFTTYSYDVITMKIEHVRPFLCPNPPRAVSWTGICSYITNSSRTDKQTDRRARPWDDRKSTHLPWCALYVLLEQE